MARNPLLDAPGGNRLVADVGAQGVTPADAWQYNAQAYQDYVARQREEGIRLGLIDPQTGWPTQAGLVDAARQYGNALLGSTSAPRGIRAYHGGPGTNPYDDSAAGMMGVIKQFRMGPEGAAFFSKEPALAGDYAAARYPERPAVYPVDLNPDAVFSWDQSKGYKSNKELADMARAAGKSVVEIQNAADNVPGGTRAPSTIYMALDPEAVSFPFVPASAP